MDERIPLSIKFITGFSISGFIFSGYVTVLRFFSDTCTACEFYLYLFAIPVYVYCFVLYTILTVLCIGVIKKQIDLYKGMLTIAGFSFVGIIFSGYFSAIQLPELMRNGFSAYTFGVPACLLALIMFMLIFATVVLGIAHWRKD